MTAGLALKGVEMHLGANDRLGLISLIDEGMRLGAEDGPIVPDLFNDLWGLIDVTVKGCKIDPFEPEDSKSPFKAFGLTAESGESLGRLNMLYLKKPVPCYYLVYVEVAAPYRRQGLGHRIIKHFKDFLEQKSALGLLDNIIPVDDPTYDLYQKHGWMPVGEFLGVKNHEGYMIYVPERIRSRRKNLNKSVIRLLHHLKRKRPAIDMRDNEAMVGQTIGEFKDLYAALMTYFAAEIEENQPTPLMRFMFTRYVTKLIAFRRRISQLIGYTGGESLEQVKLVPQIAAMEIKSYAPKELTNQLPPETEYYYRDRVPDLPEKLLEQPAPHIEALPNYRRPSLNVWLREKERDYQSPLTLGDLMELGFDPTRLKELDLDGEEYIFERIQARLVPELMEKKNLLGQAAVSMAGLKVRNANLYTNPPLMALKNRGNAYILRRKVKGIHWEEAIEQLQLSPSLMRMNNTMKLDLLIRGTVRTAMEKTAVKLDLDPQILKEKIACFVSWDLENNQPKLVADFTGTFIESVWLA